MPPCGTTEISIRSAWPWLSRQFKAQQIPIRIEAIEMRNADRLKLGYFPLPQQEARRLRRLIHAAESFSVLDPCVGTGAALHLITSDLDCRQYGIELDAERALAASHSGIETLQGNLFDAHAKAETLSMLYLNPPYDSEIGSLNNQRMELLFLEHTYRFLIMGGLLAFVVPEKGLEVCVSLLASNFTRFRIFDLTDPESIRFNQVVLMAVRKPMRGAAMESNRALLFRLLFTQPFLRLDDEHEPYDVPGTPPASIIYRGLPLDEIEDLILASPAWKQSAKFLLPKEEMAAGRPITPLHAGHVGLLCKEDDVEITRKRERFSNELCLVYQDGRTLVLTESARKPEQEGTEDAECTSTTGPT
jgi:hypothetical protein